MLFLLDTSPLDSNFIPLSFLHDKLLASVAPKAKGNTPEAGVRADGTASKGLMNNPHPSSASSFSGYSPGPHPSALFSISLILVQGLLMNKHTRKYLLSDCLPLMDCPKTRSLFLCLTQNQSFEPNSSVQFSCSVVSDSLRPH